MLFRKKKFLILPFNSFFILFMDLIILFDTIYESFMSLIILVKKSFNFNQISKLQIEPNYNNLTLPMS